MHLPEVVSPEEWLAARRELLAKEKELTRMRDRVNADRRRLPMVRIDKPYAFEGPDGTVCLLDLFEGRQQLVMHLHACLPVSEFGPSWPAGVPAQVHAMEADPEFDNGWDLPAARALVEEAEDGELFLYRGDRHLFADNSLSSYDADAAALLSQRVHTFLDRL